MHVRVIVFRDELSQLIYIIYRVHSCIDVVVVDSALAVFGCRFEIYMQMERYNL